MAEPGTKEIIKGAAPEEAAARIANRVREIAPRRGRVVVSGGRGVGGPEFFAVLEELAGLLGGEVASSRAGVRAGWIPYSYQVGSTGRRIAPDLYIACGISGTPQHRLGIEGAAHIIAINSFENAPIFEIAELGVVGDVHLVVPALIKRLRESG